MTNFIVIEKDSLEKSIVNSNQITLTEASIVHTKMHRDDVEEFIRDGNNLLLKLKNGEVIVIENFFTAYDEVISDLVFEEDGCVLYWFDGVSDFKGIPGLEVLLPEAGSQLASLLPWLAGLGAVGGIIAATHNDDDNSPSKPNGVNSIQVSSDGLITGNTENIPNGSKVNVTITGKDKDGNLISQEIETTINPDGSYTIEVPNDFADGDLKVESEVVDQNGNIVKAEDGLVKTDHDNDPSTPEQGGLDRVDGLITVDIDPATNKLTGTTTDVPAGSPVTITVTGTDSQGNPVTEQVQATVQADGTYTADLPATINPNAPIEAEAKATDNNGKPVTDTDNSAGVADGSITVDIADSGTGLISGTTVDVAANSNVVLTIKGKDATGADVEITRTVQTDADGKYSYQLVAGDGIADGSSVDVQAVTKGLNGKDVSATDTLAAQGDNDNDPTTPADPGLDLVAGAITVDIDPAMNKLTGTTTDVPAGSPVTITVTGTDSQGNPVTEQVQATVQADGTYTADLPATINPNAPIEAEAKATDNNGKPVTDTDNSAGVADGSITVDIADSGTGLISGTTVDVAANSNVVLTIKGKDATGADVEITRTVQTDADGKYSYQLVAGDGIADGSSVDVQAVTKGLNGKDVSATDTLAAQGDNDNDPTTPADPGLDLVAGAITVDIDPATNKLTGTTTDVPAGSPVTITVTGTDSQGNPVTEQVQATVQADGTYTADLPATINPNAPIEAEAKATDNNGKPVTDTDNSAGVADGSITVDIADSGTGLISGTTVDVAANSNVVLTIKGKDATGADVEITRTVQTDADGKYSYQLVAGDGIADGSSVDVQAVTKGLNGKDVSATDTLAAQGDNDNDPTTPADPGLDLVAGAITVDIDPATNKLTGTTTDVPAGSPVTITVTGTDSQGNPVTEQVQATVQADGTYTADLPATINPNAPIEAEAKATDNNGKPVTDTDNSAGVADGSITVDIADSGTGLISGTTVDVAANSNVVLTIKGKDATGADVEITRTVQTDADGKYSYQLVAGDGIADGSSVDVQAVTKGLNGKDVSATDTLAAQGDNDNDPTTPADPGLDLVAGAITVDIDPATNKLTGTTTDVPAGSPVTITVTGTDSQGNPVTEQVQATVQADGTYTADLPATINPNAPIEAEAKATDNNGKPVTDTDNSAGVADGSITVDIADSGTGLISGTTVDVAANSNVVLTIKGKDATGADVEITRTVQTDADGKYSYQLVAGDGIADGSSVDVQAVTKGLNGKDVSATDTLAAQGDNDNDPTTPADPGLDLVAGAITVDIDPATNKLTGTTTDVPAGSPVTITVTGTDSQGNPVTEQVQATVQADGTYTADLPATINPNAPIEAEAKATDNNGKPVTDTDNSAGVADGSITVDIADSGTGLISGTTVDVAANSNVVLTIKGKDATGADVEITRTVQTDADGKYSYQLVAGDGIADGSSVDVQAVTKGLNGKDVSATDTLAAQGDNDNDPTTPADPGLDLVAGAITVDIDPATNKLTGTTTDVPAGSPVTITVTGTDSQGNPVTEQVQATVQADGTYTADLPATINPNAPIEAEAKATDNNGKPVTDTDNSAGVADGSITVDIADSGTGLISGTTVDVAANSNVVLTIKGKDATGADVEITRTVQTDADGKYSYQLVAGDGIADGSSVDVQAVTKGLNGKDVSATDTLAAQGDNDNDPTTPADPGLDLVAGAITVDIDPATNKLTGTTTDVPAGSPVTITVTGTDSQGNPVTEQVQATVQADGTYTADLPATINPNAPIEAEAKATDNNGKPVTDTDNSAGVADGSITVDIADSGTGLISGTTVDVAANSNVVLTIKGKDATGADVEITRTVQTDADGKYSYQLVAGDGIADGSSVDVQAVTKGLNGKDVSATDTLAAQGDNDNDPTTPADPGLDLVAGAITVDIDPAMNKLTGTTTDVPAGSPVTITVTGTDSQGNPVTEQVQATVQADGTYTADLPATINPNAPIEAEAKATDNNGKPVTDTDNSAGVADGSITVDIADSGTGLISGTTVDVAANSNVVLTIKGKDATGADVEITRTVQTDADGKYSYQLVAGDGIADGSSVDVQAVTKGLNGKDVSATDTLAAQGDNDNDPTTPADPGLDLVAGAITVDIDPATNKLTGTTTDVPAGSPVTITVTGTDSQGNPVTEQVQATVQADGTYTADLPATINPNAPIEAEAKATDNNGKPVTDTDNSAGVADGSITVDIADSGTGLISGTTVDVAANSNVVLTIKGKDATGADVEITRTVQTDADGKYSYQLVAGDGIADGSSVDVQAVTKGLNGKDVSATDTLAAQGDNDNDPTTPADPGLDLVAGAITVDIDPATNKLTGTTTDVPAGSPVTITVTGTDSQGNPVTEQVQATVQADGTYTADLPATINPNAPIEAEAKATDNNGKPVTDTDNSAGVADGSITVDIADSGTGLISGTTVDVAANSNVVLTIKGKDATGADVEITRTVQTDADGKYSYQLVAGDGIADGSSVDVQAVTKGLNGKDVSATDTLAAQGDNDNDPTTPADPGLDLVAGAITVDIDPATNKLTGTTTDVPAGSPVTITVTGTDSQGNPVTEQVQATVQADGTYTADLPATINPNAPIEAEAKATDNNGKPVTDTDNSAGVADGSITVDIADSGTGLISGTTVDVAANSNVVLTIKGKDATGADVEITRTVQTDADGKYSYQLVAGDGIADGSSVDVQAVTKGLNGKDVSATDTLAAQGDNDNDPTTPADPGLDLVAGAITVDIDPATNKLTGTTTDVPAGSPVTITVTGTDSQGNPVTEQVQATVQADGTYTADLPATINPNAPIEAEAKATDNNGKPVTDTDNSAGVADGSITVDIADSGTGLISGTTVDVAANSNVVLTIKGKDATGADVEITRTVQTDADGKYSYQLVAGDGIADGSSVDVQAVTKGLNGKDVSATDTLAAQGDNDNDPTTPADPGLDLVAGAITVDIDPNGHISGTTTDVAPNTEVVLTITGYNENGEPIQIQRPVQTDADGHYQYDLTPTDGIIPASDGSQISVVAETNDRNGHVLNAQDSEIVEPVVKGDSSTGVTNGGDSVTGTSGDDLLAGDVGGLKTNFVAGQDYNISIVLDLSGSMLYAMNGTGNPPAGESRLAIAIKGLKAFIQQMVDHDGVINLQIASFSANGSVGNGYNQVFLNVSKDNINEIFTYLDSLKAGGGTYPEQGFNKAVDWFDDISTADFENQTYYLTDGEPNSSQSTLDNAFAPLAEQSKVFAVGVSSSISDATVSRYDNTDVNGNKLPGDWSGTNHGEAKAIADADKLIAYLIGGSENFTPADVGGDTVKGGAGDDILFGDAINTDQLTWTGYDPLQYPKYSGYSKLIAYLKAEVTSGAEPSQQDIYDYIKENFRDFIAADAADPATKGGNDTIYGGAGNDIIIAGAGNDVIYGGSGNDIISTGRGDDTIIYDLLNAADATGGNGTDTWVDYEANDKIEFGSDFFEGLLADKSNLGDYITVVDDGNGNATVQVDRDGSAGTHNMSDLLIIENQAGLTLQDLLNNNQIIIG
ncbi:BapA/Bap/LapF family prefix-like domain-containing protein [Acinetobacter pittii]|uniref:BapA/Bap/LapF family prefix-like domain-containing protein n=4 Tax=Acinetobacter pittii TaxID=48296 RepID=UPI00397923A0